MTNEQVVLLTSAIGVSGPLITLLITNHFQAKQKARENDFSLRTVWFEKKIAAAQVIMAQNTLIISSIFSINMAIKNLKFGEEEVDIVDEDFNIIEHLKNEAAKALEKAAQLDSVLSNSLFLFFNVTEAESLAVQGLVRSFYEVIKDIIPKLKVALESSPDSAERIAYNQSMDAIITKYNEVRAAIEGQMKKIRDSFSAQM